MSRESIDQLDSSNWFKLDNAGKIFAPIISKRYTTMIRVGFSLHRPVDSQLLQHALDSMMARCPYFQVQLRRGLFWYYLAKLERGPVVEEDSRYPCQYVPLKRRGQSPLRVLYSESRIAVEVAHFLTDGFGASHFLLGLVGEYLQLTGEIDEFSGVLHCRSAYCDKEEFEDSYLKHYTPKMPYPSRPSRAYHFPTPLRALLPKGQYAVTHGFVKGDRLREVSKSFGATVGEFLTASLLEALQELTQGSSLGKGQGRPLRIDVPINLRKVYPSKSMRNFTLTVLPGVDPRLGEYSFHEMVERVHHYMRYELDHRTLRQKICRNVEAESSFFIRLLPRFFKDMILKRVYRTLGHRGTTMTLSNLGVLELPEPMKRHISMGTFVFPPSDLGIGCGVISVGEWVNISFGSLLKSREFEKIFFRNMVKKGIPVRVTGNRSTE